MKIKNEKELDKLLNAIHRVLGIKESWYDLYLAYKGNKEVKDFTMPYGLGAVRENKFIIAIDDELWTEYVEETSINKKRKKYALVAGVLAHELFHLYQFKHSYKKYIDDFNYEHSLPRNINKWSSAQIRKYNNLYIEIEARAFEMLIKSILLHKEKMSLPYKKINMRQYKKVYLQLKATYEEKIKRAFSK